MGIEITILLHDSLFFQTIYFTQVKKKNTIQYNKVLE